MEIELWISQELHLWWLRRHDASNQNWVHYTLISSSELWWIYLQKSITLWWHIHLLFLALLDYVSRAHEIAICPSSVVRPLSVRPSVSQLSLNLMNEFLSNFSCGFPWAIRSDFFWIFEKKFFVDFLRIFFVFVNMGPYGSKNFKTLLLLQIAALSFQTFPEFSS